MKLLTDKVSFLSDRWVMGHFDELALHCLFSKDTCLCMIQDPVSAPPLPPVAKWQNTKLRIWENTIFYETQVFRWYIEAIHKVSIPGKGSHEKTDIWVAC